MRVANTPNTKGMHARNTECMHGCKNDSRVRVRDDVSGCVRAFHRV